MIDLQIILGWALLEKNIRDAVNLLLAHERTPATRTLVVFDAANLTPSRRCLHLIQQPPYPGLLVSLPQFDLSLRRVLSFPPCLSSFFLPVVSNGYVKLF
jgi:hypothetical protein